MELDIYFDGPLPDSITAIEDDIDQALGSLGEVTGSGIGADGGNFDVEVYEEQRIEEAVQILAQCLSKHGLLGRTRIRVGDSVRSI